ncbi:MAG: NTP transferase domain-containing protein [Candidatus Binatia bacterium]
MRAIILAAGAGSRLRPYTLDSPKCLIELGGKPLLVHQVDVLKTVGIRDVTVVTGYRADQIETLGYHTKHNPDYAHTNMVATLMCAAELLDGSDDVLIAYSDILYEPRVIQTLCTCSEPICTTVDMSWLRLWQIRVDDPLSDAETMKLDKAGNILDLGRKPNSYDDIEGQYMGLIKVRADFAPELVNIYQQLDLNGLYDGLELPNMYMTSFLQYLIDHGRPVRAVLISGGWLELDTGRDLELYKHMQREGRLSEYCWIATAEKGGQ